MLALLQYADALSRQYAALVDCTGLCRLACLLPKIKDVVASNDPLPPFKCMCRSAPLKLQEMQWQGTDLMAK